MGKMQSKTQTRPPPQTLATAQDPSQPSYTPPGPTLRKSSCVSGKGPRVVSVLMEGKAVSAAAMAGWCPPWALGLLSLRGLVGSETPMAPWRDLLCLQLIGYSP